MTTFSTKYVTLKNYVKQVEKDISAGERKRRAEAGTYLKRKIRGKIRKSETSLPGEPPGRVTGNLLRGLASRNMRSQTIVGFRPPGYHALMLEFGTENMAPRPVLFPTMAEETPTLKKILSGLWVK